MTDSIIKSECEVKQEPDIKECSLCLQKSTEFLEIGSCFTPSSSMSMADFIYRITSVNIESQLEADLNLCIVCNNLLNQLDQTIAQLDRLQKLFTGIIDKNPLFLNCQLTLSIAERPATNVENEVKDELNIPKEKVVEQVDSDDEPLVSKKKRGRKAKSKRNSQKFENKAESENSDSSKLRCAHCGEIYELDELLVKHFEVCPRINLELKDEAELEIPLKEEPNRSDSDVDWPSASELSDTVLKVSKIGRKRKISDKPRKKEKVDPIHIKNIPNAEVKLVKRNNRMIDVYSCKECPAVFTYACRIIRHMEKHDISKPPYICEICGAKYKHKKACDVHVAMHKGISDWKCEECVKIFPSKNALARHNAIHTGKPIYQCDLCGKSFIHTSSFKMHKLSHTGLKPHKCDICGLALMTRSHLKRHKRIHSGEKRHECTVCGKRFSERYNLIAHQKSHNDLIKENEIKAEKPARTKFFRCSLCELRFERRYMLERHMEVVHQRILERGPPKPRNTMTKLLKAKAAAAAAAKDNTTHCNNTDGSSSEGQNKSTPLPVSLVTKVKTDSDQSPTQPSGDGTAINFEAPNASWQPIPPYTMLYSS